MINLVHFTDPACPFAFSAEPQRLQLRWHYGDQLVWRTVLVGLSTSQEEVDASGFTTAKHAAGLRRLQEKYGMPIDSSERSRMSVSLPACRAVVATRVHRPELEEAVLRRLRVRAMGGELLDADATIDGAASDVGIDAQELRAWMGDPATEADLVEDMRIAREPLPAAQLLRHKLGGGGSRYSCPSYEMGTGERTVALPGFQPFESYDAALANLDPTLDRRDTPTDLDEVLAWADQPLATVEVAALLNTSASSASGQLEEAGATFAAVGADGYWSAS